MSVTIVDQQRMFSSERGAAMNFRAVLVFTLTAFVLLKSVRSAVNLTEFNIYSLIQS